MQTLIRRAIVWWSRNRPARKLTEALEVHRRMLERHVRAPGAGADHDKSDAARRSGNRTSITEQSRDVRRLSWLSDLAQDLRFGARALRRRLAFSGAVVATLAVAVSANSVIFTVVDRAILRPLPYPAPNQLVAVFHRDARHGTNDKASGAEVAAWSARSGPFESVAFSWDAQYTLTSSRAPVVLRGFQVSSRFFATLGAAPALGRTFAARDTIEGANRVAVLSDHLWRTEFDADRNIVGRVIRLDDAPYVVVGVMPSSFAHPDATIDLWTPLAMPIGLAANTSLHAFNVVARMRPGATVATSSAALRGDATLESLRDLYLGSARSVIWLLQGAVCFLLLIAAANVTNLVLAYATTLRREADLRRALGASSGRVARGVIAQVLVLVSVGLATGLAIADVGIGTVPAFMSQLFGAMPADLGDGISALAVAVAVLFMLLITAVAGSVMTFGSGAGSPATLLTTVRAGAGRGVARLRAAIIVAQVAVSLLLLAASALLIRSYLRLEHRSLGFATTNRLTFMLMPQPTRYPASRVSGYVEQVLAQIRAVPGVRSVAATSAIPLTGTDARRRLVLPGELDSAAANVVHYRVVSQSYFATMSIPVRSGRAFTRDDRVGSRQVAMVNELLARERWPGGSPIGETVIIAGGPAPETAEIVGVLADVRHEGPGTDPEPEIYRPLDETYWPFFGIVVQTSADPAAMTKAVERAVWSVDRTQAIDGVRTLDDIAASAVALRRASMLIVSAFALAAALLAAVGIFSVMSYVVSLRTQEIAVRLALGARPGDVMRQVVLSGTRLAFAGGAAGAVASYVLMRYLVTPLFDADPGDAVSLGVAFGAIVSVGFIASYLPARRAARTDPVTALRST